MPGLPTSAPEFVIVGGGFYGCCLALFLRSISSRIVILEAGSQLLDRASRVNQARIHTGFHYPRSPLTAVKSMVLHQRFAEDFSAAVVDDFQMLYAIARRRSLISARRFVRMFQDMGAPVQAAGATEVAMFDSSAIEAVFACTERAFDYSVLREFLSEQLRAQGVEVRLNTVVATVSEFENGAVAHLTNGEEIVTEHLFNVTYAQLNAVLRSGGRAPVQLKHELSEIALIEPPAALAGYGVTIMDGPFLSTMPYPSTALYSLTHVRYTPHASWTDENQQQSAYEIFNRLHPESRFRHMVADGVRYLPCLADAVWCRSMYEVKTVLIRNEHDDGRPIVFHRESGNSRIISILGGKIDNVYDLFELVRTTDARWAGAHDGFVSPTPTAMRGVGRG